MDETPKFNYSSTQCKENITIRSTLYSRPKHSCASFFGYFSSFVQKTAVRPHRVSPRSPVARLKATLRARIVWRPVRVLFLLFFLLFFLLLFLCGEEAEIRPRFHMARESRAKGTASLFAASPFSRTRVRTRVQERRRAAARARVGVTAVAAVAGAGAGHLNRRVNAAASGVRRAASWPTTYRP